MSSKINNIILFINVKHSCVKHHVKHHVNVKHSCQTKNNAFFKTLFLDVYINKFLWSFISQAHPKLKSTESFICIEKKYSCLLYKLVFGLHNALKEIEDCGFKVMYKFQTEFKQCL